MITLKNIKYAAFASEETHCFTATVYKDGKKWCIADNDGRGGATSFYPVKGCDYKELRAEILAFEKTLPLVITNMIDSTTDKPYELDNSLEMVACDLMNEWLEIKECKKILKRVSYIGKDGGLYQLAAKVKPTIGNLSAVKRSAWWKKDYIMLNELSFDEAVKLINKAA